MTEIPERLAAALHDRYRLERPLGAGGMATVYLAQDLKHDRKVAVKVLKPELAAVLGAERFVVEIKTTAALQHPHILPLFDSGTADGFLFYVMPYVEGETLRGKLDRERQFGVDEAVRITREIADALDYAHRHGVVHRDIKPENILLHDGRPMVADFGIALAVSAAAGGRMTETGLSLGTPHYMSPEQATAEKDITGRSDIYSLGSVLYEMLTGEPPHTGASGQQIIMKIITETARPVTELRRSVPPHVADAVARSLEKLPADRFESAKAFADALADSTFTLSATRVGGRAGVASAPTRAIRGLATATLLFAALAAWGWLRPGDVEPSVHRYLLSVPDSQAAMTGTLAPLVAPGGAFIVYSGPTPGNPSASQLWVKHRDRVDAMPIPGTLGAVFTALSPDGEWIAFTQQPSLRKVRVSGGVPVTLVQTRVQPHFGVAWRADGTIVFVSTNDSTLLGRSELRVVSADGGAHRLLLSDSVNVAYPSLLPKGRGLLYTACATATVCRVMALTNDEAEPRVVVEDAFYGQASASGHLIFFRGGGLEMTAFDLRTLTVRGKIVPLGDQLAPGVVAYRLSHDGTLIVIRTGVDPAVGLIELVWVDRSGRTAPVDTTWRFRPTLFGGNHGLALSPDGSRVAVGVHTDAGDHIWVKDVRRAGSSAARVTFTGESNMRPRWTPDGERVQFLRRSNEARGIVSRRADGTGRDSLVLSGDYLEAGETRSGWILFRLGGSNLGRGGRDILARRPGADTSIVRLLATSDDENGFSVSPDGRWIAYCSDENGRSEVYLRPFPDVEGGRWQVSTGGGYAPVWARDSRELFFLSESKAMMAVRVEGAQAATLSAPVRLFDVPNDRLRLEWTYYAPWDVAADGRFIMAREVTPVSVTKPEIVITENVAREWRALLKQ